MRINENLIFIRPKRIEKKNKNICFSVLALKEVEKNFLFDFVYDIWD